MFNMHGSLVEHINMVKLGKSQFESADVIHIMSSAGNHRNWLPQTPQILNFVSVLL